jgi:opacity protein-like surface antigen
MKNMLLIVWACLVLSVAAIAQDVTAPVKAMLDGFNSGDMNTVVAQYAPGGITIVDEVPPFHWSGP